MHEFEEIETAALAALAPLRTVGLRTLDLYTGQIDADDVEAAAAVTRLLPCIFVVAGPIEIRPGNRADEAVVTLTLIVGARGLRGAEDIKLGDAGSPGIYPLLEGARGLLHRRKVASGWAPFLARREEIVFWAPKRGLCFYAAQYSAARVQ